MALSVTNVQRWGPGWGGEWSQGTPCQIESILEALGISSISDAASNVHLGLSNPEIPGRDFCVLLGWKFGLPQRKFMAAWEKVVAARTFLTLSSLLAVPKACQIICLQLGHNELDLGGLGCSWGCLGLAGHLGCNYSCWA